MMESAEPILDTHADVRELTESGFTLDQAEIVVRQRVDLLRHHLVTKSDLRLFENSIDARFKEQDARIDAGFREQDARIDAGFKEQNARIDARFNAQDARIEAAFKGQDAKFEARFKDLLHETRSEIKDAKTDIIKWMAGLNVAAMIGMAGVLLAAIKLL